MNVFKVLRTAVLAVLFFLIVHIIFSERAAAQQQKIADELIRFHVRANSDSEEDQQLKLEVKNTVVNYMEQILDGSQSVEESGERIEKNMEGILREAVNTIHAQGYDYDVYGYMVKEYFPLRVYGDIALPPGEYTAFRIDIGEAEGKNWWCVLYPPLCFVDITHGVVPKESKEEFQNIIGEEEAVLTDTCSLEFKYLKFLNKYLE